MPEDRGTREMVYFRNSRFTDVGVHEPILAEGNDNAATLVSIGLLRKWGLMPEPIDTNDPGQTGQNGGAPR